MAEILFKELSFAVIGAAMEVHRVLGPGFLEAIYQAALEKELTLRGIPFQPQVDLPVRYKGDLMGTYKAELVIEGKIIVEIKGVSRLRECFLNGRVRWENDQIHPNLPDRSKVYRMVTAHGLFS